jgi:hypothetical protein
MKIWDLNLVDPQGPVAGQLLPAYCLRTLINYTYFIISLLNLHLMQCILMELYILYCIVVFCYVNCYCNFYVTMCETTSDTSFDMFHVQPSLDTVWFFWKMKCKCKSYRF